MDKKEKSQDTGRTGANPDEFDCSHFTLADVRAHLVKGPKRQRRIDDMKRDLQKADGKTGARKPEG